MSAHAVYDALHAAYGPQHWWPGDTPFEVMVGAVLTQNTGWVNVERAIDNLKANGALDPYTILDVDPQQLAGWLKPSGYFNVKAQRLRNLCRWYLAHGGHEGLSEWDTTRLREGLLSVNGVGKETADDILLYAFARPVFVVDAYTRRIFSRLGLVAPEIDYESLRGWFETELGTVDGATRVFNEYHALIVNHGKDVCRPKPRCAECCLKRRCAGFT